MVFSFILFNKTNVQFKKHYRLAFTHTFFNSFHKLTLLKFKKNLRCNYDIKGNIPEFSKKKL